MDIMLDDYMLKNISINTKVVLGGYPRNEIFFDKERAKELKKELNLENKQIIVYFWIFSDIKSLLCNAQCLVWTFCL